MISEVIQKPKHKLLRNNEHVQYTHSLQVIDFCCFYLREWEKEAEKRLNDLSNVKSNALIAFSQLLLVGAEMDIYLSKPSILIPDTFSSVFSNTCIDGYPEEDHCLHL